MPDNATPQPDLAHPPEPNEAPFPVVGIGASAGGLEALTLLLQALPADTGLAFVIVQHLHPTYPTNLAELLSRNTAMPVREIVEATPLQPNHVHVIPPNVVLTVSGTTLHLGGRPEGRRLHMPIDHFFQSLAREFHSQAIGVVLSGTGSDGTQGLEAIKAEGGISFAQDASARFDGMPQSAVAAGCVDAVLSPQAIAEELTRISKHPYVRPEPAEQAPQGPANLGSVYALLQRTHGVDFTFYKQSTLRRRIQRRMVLHHLDTIDDYSRLLQAQPEECRALFHDVLINVTGFFRDPDAFDALRTRAFPALLKDRPAGSPIRLWVVGCSSGEEAYSLAIVLLEFLETQPQPPPLKIFATDVSLPMLEKARLGIYPDSITADVSPERLRRYFTRLEHGYQISKSIRELCVFARQDVTRDPPFANMDLVSCRNLLIYLEPALQRRVLPLLHYALADRGVLLLGNSESVGPFTDLFTPVDVKHRLYARAPGSRHLLFNLMTAEPGRFLPPAGPPPAPPALNLLDVQREADRVVLGTYAPAGVVVNENFEVIQFRGRTGMYLEPAPGLASTNVLKMAREGLLVELRRALAEALKSSTRVYRTGLRVRTNGGYEEINLEVLPILVPPERRRFFLVLFEPVGQKRPRPPESAAPPLAVDTTAEQEIARLQQELASTRDYMQSLIEALEANNEELKAANEEVISTNEELQSTNEELQTAREEMQATNEELSTTNDELQHRIHESYLLADDLTNLLTSVEIPILMLGQDLCIRRFTPSAGKVLNLLPGDVGRPIGNLKPRFHCPDLDALLRAVLANASPQEREVQDDGGNCFWLGIRPYRTADNKIDGVVLGFLDITQRKRTEEQLRDALRQQQTLLREVHHRVKNNLQIISSMLQLQSRACPEEPSKAVLRECQQRVEAMAHIHETLYQSGDLRQVDFAVYGRRMAQDLLRFYLTDQKQITPISNFESIQLDLDVAIPCGLILNELVSNAIKHAFPDRRSGQLVLGLRRGQPGQLLLSVADDGIGFSPDWENRGPASLGLYLVKVLAQQLRGTLAIRRRDNWTEVEVAFQEPASAQEKTP